MIRKIAIPLLAIAGSAPALAEWTLTTKTPAEAMNQPKTKVHIIAALTILLFLFMGTNICAADIPSPVTAIDVLLEPDATMLKHAAAANQRLRKNYPKGFALDETHRPHITTLQRFVKTAELDKVYEALGKVLAEENPSAWKLKAYKYYYIPYEGLGLAGIVIEPTNEFIRFQQKVVDAVAPFTVETGTPAAFVTTKEAPDINQPTIDYVTAYVPNQVGEKFNPHVTIGLAAEDYVKKMLDKKFKAFTFSVTGLSVYRLGNFGTARTKLKDWELKPSPK